ncbi:MAG: PfkB family carbohydrate kinase [Pelolinea sp.]|nr:PfkB family carbohydrate kinase [Pelolinea sp.]
MINNTNNHIDYLIIGHVTQDIHEDGRSIGGTAAYSAFCARALGRKPAILTAGARAQLPQELEGFQIVWKNSKNCTTFENIETEHGRKQLLHTIADPILPEDVPQDWSNASIVHLGPVANEVDPGMIDIFPNSFIGLTPQGWMRARDEDHIVHFHEWDGADNLLNRANAVVLSIEDVEGDEEIIQSYASKTKILAVTEGYNGARVYWNGDVRHLSAPKVSVLDATGAGDIFAAVFFDRLEKTSDPWESAKIAVKIASRSVTRKGLAGVPTAQEIRSFQIEIIEGK